MSQKNDGSFLVRAPKEDIDKFNEILERQAINRSALLRNWIKDYIKKNE